MMTQKESEQLFIRLDKVIELLTQINEREELLHGSEVAYKIAQKEWHEQHTQTWSTEYPEDHEKKTTDNG